MISSESKNKLNILEIKNKMDILKIKHKVNIEWENKMIISKRKNNPGKKKKIKTSALRLEDD